MSCMQSPGIGKKSGAYLVLFIILGISGHVLASAVEHYKISQYICNFIYGVLITLFLMENWTLLMDSNQLMKDAKQIEPHVKIIKQLTETNHTLVQRNTALKNELKSINQREAERGHEAIRYIMHWRSEMDARSNNSPTLSHMTNELHFKNNKIKLPNIIWDQNYEEDDDDESPSLSSTEDF